MISGMNFMGGLSAGAATPRTCAAHSHLAGSAAPIPAVWLDGAKRTPVTPAPFADRPIPRPLERST